MTALRVAVIGASGMGRHHLKWLRELGCDVVAFAGSSPESVATTHQMLQDLFGWSGQGLVGAQALLDAVKPDLVTICSPPNYHHEHFLLAAQRGCHILCEKPLVWDPNKDTARLLAEGQEMAALAEQRGLIAAINTQYVAAAQPYLQLCELAGKAVDPHGFREFYMRMDSRGGRQGASGAKIWLDLASHPLSLLIALAGPGTVVSGSESCRISERRVEASFRYLTSQGREVVAQIQVCNVPEGPLVRRFGVDGVLADYEGRNDENGVFSAYLKLGGHQLKATDFVRTSICSFVNAVRGQGNPLADVRDGLTNLQMQLHLLDLAVAESPPNV